MKKIQLTRIALLFPCAFLASVTFAATPCQSGPANTDEVSASDTPFENDAAHGPSDFRLNDLTRLTTPADLVTLVRNEIHGEVRDFKRDLRGVRQGEPESIVKAAFTGARLAGADAGTITAAKLAYQFITRDPAAPQPTLHEVLPGKLADAPDRTVRHLARSSIRHGFSGDMSGVVTGDLRGQAFELVPATLHSVRLFFTAPLKAELPTKVQS